MANLNDLYRYAVYYDIVFPREVDTEIDFLTELVRRHRGRPPGSAAGSWAADPAITPEHSPGAG